MIILEVNKINLSKRDSLGISFPNDEAQTRKLSFAPKSTRINQQHWDIDDNDNGSDNYDLGTKVL